MIHTINRIKEPLCLLVKKTGLFIQQQKGTIKEEQIDTKSKNSFVTFVDKEAEKKLVQGLTELIPDSGFITEEGTAKETNSNWRWIIDPLDGTTNYIHNIYPVSVSVALQYKQKTVAGVVYEIGNNELFSAFEKGVSQLNGQPIQTSKRPTISESLFATGFPYYDYKQLPGYLQILSEFMQTTRGIRRLGSAATDLAYVACGRFDAFFEYSLNPWDVAAGAFIVEKAGGFVQDFNGKNNYIFGREIIASSKQIADNVQKTIKKHIDKN